MTSQKQLDANRKNALKSTGPRTESGLQVISRNALQVGVFSEKHFLLPGEDSSEFQTMLVNMAEEFGATTQTEKMLVEKMAISYWKKQRLMAIEQQMIQANELTYHLEQVEETSI